MAGWSIWAAGAEASPAQHADGWLRMALLSDGVCLSSLLGFNRFVQTTLYVDYISNREELMHVSLYQLMQKTCGQDLDYCMELG